LWAGRIRDAIAPMALIAVCELTVSAFYLSSIFTELQTASRMTPAPGWTWRSLTGASELLGIATVLGFDLPKTAIRDRIELETLLTILMLFGFVHTVRKSRDALTYVILLSASLAVCAISVYRHKIGVINANHGYVKALSQFAMFLLLPVLVGLDNVTRCRLRSPVLLFSLVAAIVGFEVKGLAYSRHVDSWYTEDLITLVRNDLKNAPLIALQEKYAISGIGECLTRDVKKIRYWKTLDERELRSIDRRAVLVFENTSPKFPVTTVHSRGKYTAVTPDWCRIH
jgi:hypothetical protein